MSWVFCYWQLKEILTDTYWVFCLSVLCCSPCQFYPLWQQNDCSFVSVDHVVQRWKNTFSSPASQSPESHLDWTSLGCLLSLAPMMVVRSMECIDELMLFRFCSWNERQVRFKTKSGFFQQMLSVPCLSPLDPPWGSPSSLMDSFHIH